MIKFDWLDIVRKIKAWASRTESTEINKRNIEFADRLAKQFNSKYVYTVYYEEGFDCFLHLENTKEIDKWRIDNYDKIDDNINIVLSDKEEMIYDAKYFYEGHSHVRATNITKEDINKYMGDGK